MQKESTQRSLRVKTGTSSRREFLLGAGVTITGVALCPGVLAEVAQSEAPKAAAPAKMRGLMVDAARVPETLDYYRRVIEFCADWELNTLHFRLADDQGTALRFATVPGLVTHGNAFTPEELRQLAEYARRHGVDLIPELESFGHTGFITRSPTYAHLLDRDANGSAEFTGVIPVHPQTLELFDKLYREMAEIFPSPYLHGGCDEVNWGGSDLSRGALQAKSRPQIWAEYLNALNQSAQKLEKQFIVWGDLVLHKDPQILALLSKDIIIMDWNYTDTSSTKVHDARAAIRANGSRAIGAPALINYQWGPRAGAPQLRNVDAFADAYFASPDPGSLGVILTNWVPSRYVQNSIWDGFAYASVAFNHGTDAARTTAFRRFVEKHYRAEWNQNWSEAFQIMYDAAPSMKDSGEHWTGLVLTVPWNDDAQLAELLKDKSPRANPFTRLLSLLAKVQPSVLKNKADFQAFQLSAEYLETVFWRSAIGLEHTANPFKREDTDSLIQTIAARDRALAEALSNDWDRGRFPDSAAKREPVTDLEPKDQLVFQWQRAASYSASLASHPDRFYQLLKAAQHG